MLPEIWRRVCLHLIGKRMMEGSMGEAGGGAEAGGLEEGGGGGEGIDRVPSVAHKNVCGGR